MQGGWRLARLPDEEMLFRKASEILLRVREDALPRIGQIPKETFDDSRSSLYEIMSSTPRSVRRDCAQPIA